MTADRSTGTARPTGRTRSAVVGYLRLHPGSTPRAVADGTQLPRETVKKALQRLAADGEVTVAGERGHYFLARSRHRHLSPVPPSGDTPGAGTVPPAQAGDTTAEGDAPDAVRGDMPDAPAAEPAGQWVCGCCFHRQAIGSVRYCEQCGASRPGSVPR